MIDLTIPIYIFAAYLLIGFFIWYCVNDGCLRRMGYTAHIVLLWIVLIPYIMIVIHNENKELQKLGILKPLGNKQPATCPNNPKIKCSVNREIAPDLCIACPQKGVYHLGAKK